jgi:hypothetical protein
MGVGLEFIIPFLFIIGLAAIIGAVVYIVLRLRSGEPFLISLGFLLRVYLYMASLISLLVMMSGLTGLANAGLSQAFGEEFSYRPENISRPAPPRTPGEDLQLPTEEETQQLRDEGLARAVRRGVIDGISTTLAAGLLFAAHWGGRRALESPEERQQAYLNRIYVFLLLVIFGVGTIVNLPQAIVQSITFGMESGSEELFRQPPGSNLATALVFIPFWLYYLANVLRQVRRGDDQA